MSQAAPSSFFSSDLVGISALTVWWGGLFALGCPAPHYDDLFFTGVAVSVAQGGGLTNPWIENWMIPFGTSAYYVQPPFHPMLLAAWIKIAGLGDHSLRAFAVGCSWLATLCQWRLARRAGLSPALAVAAAWVGTVWLLGRGLRPDALALALVGLAALGWTAGTRWAWFGGSLCGAAAPLVQPFAAALVLPLLVWRLVASFSNPDPGTGRRSCGRDVLLAAVAALIVFGLFLVCLDGNLREFWRVFTAHARIRSTSLNESWKLLTTFLTLGWEPILKWPAVIVFGAAVAAGLRQTESRRRAVIGLALCAAFVTVGITFYAAYVLIVAYGVASVATLYLLPSSRSATRPGLLAAWSLAVFLQLTPMGLQALLSQPARQEPKVLRQQIDDLLADPARRLLVDEYAARHVYDWHLPPRSGDWLHSHFDATKPEQPRRYSDKRREEVWLIDGNKLEQLFPDSGYTAARISWFGRRTSMPLHPGDLRIVP